MNDQQLLSALLKWFDIMCDLKFQSEAQRRLFISRGATDFIDFKALTQTIQAEIETRKTYAPEFMPAQETAITQHSALGIMLMWLKGAPGWTEADGMTKESLIAMLEKEMGGFEIGWQ